MSHSFEEVTFKGKLISQLSPIERNQYRRALQKDIKKSIKERERRIKQNGGQV